ncbi:5'-methylthioadenosine/S-adenosylhomocysteine nucleosidase [Fimbriiglobus ruber]|uniref:5'-methylthioadenosine nucleosidase n=1 Tax=Fimbriiglobus ruber TaxID=1908690 RepID=A0A225DPP8_9BACT|nr:5'-methylthioadenosine/S-adenosylhomocysteine nucleosidase [Fimbriiglobus ruber]OWK43410.1 5'-methylthioadenosine nucleosidase [Fimbriiglobus ruber]
MSATPTEVALLTPLPEEKDALAATFVALGRQPVPVVVGRLSCVRFPDVSLTVAVGGHGKAQFGIQTQHLLDHGAYRLVICAGAAGSLRDDVGVGDVVAATATVEHDYTLLFASRPLPRFDGHAAALNSLRQLPQRTALPFRLHFGPVASGDEDVVATERAKELASKTGALCVAWEGAGAARACRFGGVPFMELRGVTDHADKSAPQDFDHNLPLCMGHLGQLLDAWLPLL